MDGCRRRLRDRGSLLCFAAALSAIAKCQAIAIPALNQLLSLIIIIIIEMCLKLNRCYTISGLWHYSVFRDISAMLSQPPPAALLTAGE